MKCKKKKIDKPNCGLLFGNFKQNNTCIIGVPKESGGVINKVFGKIMV